MRLRHIPGAERKIAESPYVVQDPESKKGQWADVFGNRNPIHIEVGMGKGKFIMELAQLCPEINFVGVERYPSVLLKAIQKQNEQKLPNLVFLCVNAEDLGEIFADGETDRIYLNFSDPWPKDRHAKRRLTSPRFMELYDRILSPDGTVEFKTDNRKLFEYSLETVRQCGWRILRYTFDLYDSPYLDGNVMTEYESRFVEEGKPICKLTAIRGDAYPYGNPASVSLGPLRSR